MGISLKIPYSMIWIYFRMIHPHRHPGEAWRSMVSGSSFDSAAAGSLACFVQNAFAGFAWAPWNRAVQGRFYQWKTRFYQCKLGFLTDLTKKSSLVLLTPSSFGSKIRKNTQLHQTWHLEGSILSFEVIEVWGSPSLRKPLLLGSFCTWCLHEAP